MSEGVDPRDRTTIGVHYYRAMVGRADIWRMRMDATTNWAIGVTAAMVSFTLGSPDVPHYVMHIAAGMTVTFLFLEARRLTFYHLWQQRVLALEEGLIAPALAPSKEAQAGQGASDLASDLSEHLGRTVPTMPLAKAAARRLRRVYVYLFAAQGLAWLLKLANHPEPTRSLAELVARADAVVVPGGVLLAVSFLAFAVAVGMAWLQGGRRSV
ncbi:MAG: DUF2270 domain-containing protein [Myxococcota bacterium]|nr:DUF2270 domain-containing protein [Myxococcota bacterium]